MRGKQINSIWVKHLPSPKEKADFEETLRNSRYTLGRLKEILEDQLKSLERQEGSSDDYDTPSWSHKQADRNGAKRELRKVLDLLSFLGDK